MPATSEFDALIEDLRELQERRTAERERARKDELAKAGRAATRRFQLAKAQNVRQQPRSPHESIDKVNKDLVALSDRRQRRIEERIVATPKGRQAVRNLAATVMQNVNRPRSATPLKACDLLDRNTLFLHPGLPIGADRDPGMKEVSRN